MWAQQPHLLHKQTVLCDVLHDNIQLPFIVLKVSEWIILAQILKSRLNFVLEPELISLVFVILINVKSKVSPGLVKVCTISSIWAIIFVFLMIAGNMYVLYFVSSRWLWCHLARRRINAAIRILCASIPGFLFERVWKHWIYAHDNKRRILYHALTSLSFSRQSIGIVAICITHNILE